MKKVIVDITLREGVLDPQGKAIHHALDSLKFSNVKDVRVGKQVIMEVEDACTHEEVENMCETLLANTVIEDYSIKIV